MTLGHRIVVMNGGVIQQVDTPLNLYREPVNRFVAGFIGSPAMNFITGNVNGNCFIAGALQLKSGALNHTGHAVLGIRPEDLVQSVNDHNALFTATLKVIERMGHETVVYFRLNGVPMVARLENDIAALPGDDIAFAIKDNKWHLFEPGTEGKRICG